MLGLAQDSRGSMQVAFQCLLPAHAMSLCPHPSSRYSPLAKGRGWKEEPECNHHCARLSQIPHSCALQSGQKGRNGFWAPPVPSSDRNGGSRDKLLFSVYSWLVRDIGRRGAARCRKIKPACCCYPLLKLAPHVITATARTSTWVSWGQWQGWKGMQQHCCTPSGSIAVQS